MITLADSSSGLTALVKHYKRLVMELIQALPVHGETIQLEPTPNAFKAGLDASRTWLVRGGNLGMRCQNRKLLLWDEGDMIFPDAGGTDIDTVTYYADAPVLLTGFDTLELVNNILPNQDLAKIWTRTLITLQSIMVRVLASYAPDEPHATPGFAFFNPGDILIRQGDTADYVLSLFEGTAEVVVDGVSVGEVGEGEVVGALAVLTHSPRSATVRAKTRCSVVKVPKNQFKDLIRSNPTMIHGLLTDMARQIINLNNRVVSLSG